MGSSAAGAASISSPSTYTAKLSGSMRTSGRASFSRMSALVTPRVESIAANRLPSASFSARPSSRAGAVTKLTELAAGARPIAPYIGRGRIGCGVGMEALASPICAYAICPPLMTSSGLTPKNAGSHSTRSASLPVSTEPISRAMPWARAGLIVYLAT
ncbi:hypothetical protein SFUMM280S_02908 [Streptomyces fumanus]